MPPDPTTFNDALAPLRVKYLARLRESRQEIADFHTACEKATSTQKEREVMCQRAHKLAGTGKAYGFAGISETARILEEALDKNMRTDKETLAILTLALLSECDQALAGLEELSLELVEAEATEPSQLLTVGQKPLLLVADDDPNIQEMIDRLFGEEAEIITASNGKEALRLIEERRPDVVLLDDAMPEMTGLEVLGVLRTKPELSGIQVVMLTANNREKDIIRGLTDGAVNYVTKPFNALQLKTKVMPYLHKRTITVLIADDDALVRELLAHKLHASGLRVLMAENGQQALELARTHRPQLAVLDRMMPKIDGLTVLKNLREQRNTRDIPVLFLTSKHKKENVLEALQLGAADYLIKPFSPEDVLSRCLRLLKGEKKA